MLFIKISKQTASFNILAWILMFNREQADSCSKEHYSMENKYLMSTGKLTPNKKFTALVWFKEPNIIFTWKTNFVLHSTNTYLKANLISTKYGSLYLNIHFALTTNETDLPMWNVDDLAGGCWHLKMLISSQCSLLVFFWRIIISPWMQPDCG